MRYSFCISDLNQEDFNKIHQLDKRVYDKRYLISAKDIEERYKKNSSIYFVIRDIKGRLVGYISVIPLKYKAYLRIKNGEIDKEVITIDDIISSNEEVIDLYFDSIVIDNKFRKDGLGLKFSLFVFQQLALLYPNYKRILGNTVSEGGLRILQKRGLNKVEKDTGFLTIVEKVTKGKSYVRKQVYKDRDKKVIERKRVRKIELHSFLE